MDMETLLAAVALLVALGAAALAWTVRAAAARAATQTEAVQRDLAAAREGLAAAERASAALRAELEAVRGQGVALEAVRAQVAELRQAVESPPPPPLPRGTRSAGLDDLRQQLRAAAQEAEEDEG